MEDKKIIDFMNKEMKKALYPNEEEMKEQINKMVDNKEIARLSRENTYLKEVIRSQKELLKSELKLEKDKVKYLMKQLKKQDEVLEAIKKVFYDKLYNWHLLDNMSSLKLDNEPKEYEIIRQWIKQWLGGRNNDK